jgi:hypothetical protein
LAAIDGLCDKHRVVGWCRLTLSNPRQKRLELSSLKLKHDKPLSHFAFKFSLRRYSVEKIETIGDAYLAAGAYTRPLFGST